MLSSCNANPFHVQAGRVLQKHSSTFKCVLPDYVPTTSPGKYKDFKEFTNQRQLFVVADPSPPLNAPIDVFPGAEKLPRNGIFSSP